MKSSCAGQYSYGDGKLRHVKRWLRPGRLALADDTLVQLLHLLQSPTHLARTGVITTGVYVPCIKLAVQCF